MPCVKLVRLLLAGEVDFLRVDNHHVVSAIVVRSVCRFVLSSQDANNLRCHATNGLVTGIYQVPQRLRKPDVRHLLLPFRLRTLVVGSAAAAGGRSMVGEG